MAKKTIKYTEPSGYFPKELREKIVKAAKDKKTTSKKSK